MSKKIFNATVDDNLLKLFRKKLLNENHPIKNSLNG